MSAKKKKPTGDTWRTPGSTVRVGPLGDAAPAIVTVLEQLRAIPEVAHPFVVVQCVGGGAFVQFVGSAQRPLVFDLPLRDDAVVRAMTLEKRAKRTQWGIAIEGITPGDGAQLATWFLGQFFGVSREQELEVEAYADGAAPFGLNMAARETVGLRLSEEDKTMNESTFGSFGVNAEYGGASADSPGALASGAPVEMRPVPSALTEALRAEFRRLIEPENFLENLAILEGLARSTRALTMTIGVTPKSPNPPGQPQPAEYYAFGNAAPLVGPVGYNKNPEQFGARAIRELVSLVPEIAAKVAQSLRQSPANLVEAIHSAKEKGLDDLAAKLQAKLLDAIDEDEAPAPTALQESRAHAHNAVTNGTAVVA